MLLSIDKKRSNISFILKRCSMKNTNRQSNKQNNLSHSDICFLSDDELRKLFISVRTRINKNRRKRLKSRDLEVELCYIQK